MLLLSLFAISSFAAVAQEEFESLQISAQGKTIKASLIGGENISTLTLTHGGEGKMVIINSNAKNETKLVRQYMLVTSGDEDLKISFSSKSVGITSALLKDIFAKTEKGKIYNLYTIATPADPKEAALVRVRRILLCKVQIK